MIYVYIGIHIYVSSVCIWCANHFVPTLLYRSQIDYIDKLFWNEYHSNLAIFLDYKYQQSLKY